MREDAMSLADSSIFFDINLPKPTTWFYFSWLLAVALFFKFSRVFSMRNLDVLTLFLFMPGLLLLAEAEHAFWGYFWLMIASLYFLARCLVDLTLVGRPALRSNLDFSGLAWLAGALFISLVAVAVRQPALTPDSGSQEHPDNKSTSISDKVPTLPEKAIKPYTPPGYDSSLRLWVERGLALLCHLSVVVGLVLIGWRHFDSIHSGMAAATFYLLLPYTFLLLPDSPLGIGRWDHAWPMALLVWTIFTYRRPILAGIFLGIAMVPAFFLVVTVPAWVGFYRDRGALRFLLSLVVSAGIGLGLLGGLLWLNGELPSSLQSDWTRFGWQPWKRPDPATPGFWQDIPSSHVARMPAAYRVPVFIASMALVAMTAMWPSPKNLAHVIALSAATLISIQLWYADRGGVYVLWYLPLVLLLVFRPNLASSRPPLPSGDDWPARLGRSVGKLVLRLVRRPQPPVEKVR
jgi:hypothetical protein